MTETRIPQAGFGRVLGETERAAAKLHLRLLAEAGTDFESWAAFNLLTDSSGAVPKASLVADLAGRLDVDPSVIEGLLGRLASRGYIAVRDGGTATIELTEPGETYFRGVRQKVDGVLVELLDPIDPHDVETTINVLRAFGDNAAARLTR